MGAADPHLEMLELTLDAPITGAPAQAVGGAVVNLLLQDVVHGDLPRAIAVTLRATTGHVWRLVDLDAIDDVVRALIRRDQAEAVVVIAPRPVPPELDGDRCVAFVTECKSGSFDHLVVFRSAPTGDQFRLAARPGDPHTPFRWLHVPPTGEIDLWVEGIVGVGGVGRGGGGAKA